MSAGSVIQLQRFGRRVLDDEGRLWNVCAMGARRDDGRWVGWLEFLAEDSGEVRVTGRETTQSTLTALAYWATGLEPVYFDGAFARSTPALSAR